MPISVDDIKEAFDDVELLTALIIGEAEGEPLEGKIAVGCVVRNRVNDRRWPDNWEGVILQPFQFSCFLGEYVRPSMFDEDYTQQYFRDARSAALGIVEGYTVDNTNGANHYHANYIRTPNWAKGKTPCFELGGHKFYKL